MYLRKLINRFLLRIGATRIVKGTPPAELSRFLASVHPVLTEHALIRIGGGLRRGVLGS